MSRELVITALQSALPDLCCTELSAMNTDERRTRRFGIDGMDSPRLNHA